jgi:hypothetical protein
VSLFYLKGESSDRTRQDSWMEGHFEDEEPVITPKFKPAPVRSAPSGSGSGSLVEPMLNNPAFREMVRKTVLDVLRSPEGRELISQAVRHELNKR